MIYDTLTCQSPQVCHTVSFTSEGFILLMAKGSYSLRVNQLSEKHDIKFLTSQKGRKIRESGI